MAETTLTRHPIRGFFWGLATGIGVALLLMVFAVIPLSIPSLIVYAAVSAVLGAVWGVFAPPKRPKGPAPMAPPPAAPGPA